MFLAAFTSACSVCPQAIQLNAAWLLRFSGARCLQLEQVCDVCLGFTGIVTTPDEFALSSSLFLNRDQDWFRISFMSYVLARIFYSPFGGFSHVLDSQVLYGNHVAVSYRIGRGLLHPVPARVRHSGREFGNGALGSRSPDRSLLLLGKLAVEPASSGPLRG